MIQLVEDNRRALEALCRKYRVAILEVFGSASDGSFSPETSDLDFLVTYQHAPDMDAADQYFGLLLELQELFDRRVDLVMATAMKNSYFIRSVNANRQVFYAA